MNSRTTNPQHLPPWRLLLLGEVKCIVGRRAVPSPHTSRTLDKAWQQVETEHDWWRERAHTETVNYVSEEVGLIRAFLAIQKNSEDRNRQTE